MEQPAISPSFVGIDVSKDRLDVHVRPSGQTFAVARAGKGLERLTNELRVLTPVLIVLEATGGFETTVAAALASAGLPLAVVNPRQIRDFARATGREASWSSVIPCAQGCSRPVSNIHPTSREGPAWRNANSTTCHGHRTEQKGATNVAPCKPDKSR